MQLVKQLYNDDNGNLWEIEKCSLPKKRGTFNFWVAECKALSKNYRENTKKDVIAKIKLGQ